MGRKSQPPLMSSAVVQRSRGGANEMLIARIASGPQHGRWTFPSGAVEPGESPEAAVRRAMEHLLGLKVTVLYGQPPFDQALDGVEYRWRFFFCDAGEGEARTEHFSEVRWIPPGALREYEFEPVSQQVADWLVGESPDGK